jgi:hypothetical protein
MRAPRRGAVALGLVLSGLLAAGTGCSPVDQVKAYRELAAETAPEANRTWDMLPAAPDDLFRVVAEGDGKTVEVLRSEAGLWGPGAGAVPTTGSLMQDAEDHLLPLPAYRRLTVDPSDPAFGLTGPLISLTAESRTGKRWTVRVGGPNPSGGGYYAQRDGDSHVYVIVNQAADDIRSLLLGSQFVRPPDPVIEQALEQDAETEDPEEVTNPWLGQVLETSGEQPSP